MKPAVDSAQSFSEPRTQSLARKTSTGYQQRTPREWKTFAMSLLTSAQLRLPTTGRQQSRLVARAASEPQSQSRRAALTILTSGRSQSALALNDVPSSENPDWRQLWQLQSRSGLTSEVWCSVAAGMLVVKEAEAKLPSSPSSASQSGYGMEVGPSEELLCPSASCKLARGLIGMYQVSLLCKHAGTQEEAPLARQASGTSCKGQARRRDEAWHRDRQPAEAGQGRRADAEGQGGTVICLLLMRMGDWKCFLSGPMCTM